VNGPLAKPFYQYYILSNITSDPNFVTLIYLPSGILALLIAPYLGKLADKIIPYLGMIITGILGAIATLLLINTYNPWGFMVILILDSTCATTEGLILQNFISRVTKTHRGKLFGLRSLFGQIGGVIGPVVGGLLWDSLGMKWPFIVSIFVELALIPLFIIAMKKTLPHLAEK
jgi:MFS family permease